MSLLDAAMWSLHVGFAVLWTGSVFFVTLAVVPLATRGTIGTDALATVVDRLRWITRIAALAFLASGGHMAGTLYTVESLTGTGRGHLVLTMIALWFLITGLVEVASGKLADGLTPVSSASPPATRSRSSTAPPGSPWRSSSPPGCSRRPAPFK